MINNRKPDWIKAKANSNNSEVLNILNTLGLNTVCEEAACPNCGECFGKRTATFMILGRNCTRNCRFCNVSKGMPSIVDDCEPQKIAKAVKELSLRHVVITSVTRDDILDGGASHFAEVIKAIKQSNINTTVIEVLIPDFKGNLEALEKVISAKPDIINHNIETVPRLYSAVRPEAEYKRSLELIERVSSFSNIYTKSGIMVGLGETYEEVLQVFKDLVKSGCSLLTIGQYLAPTKAHYPVYEYIEPSVFDKYKQEGEKAGFKYVASGPLVRSSYMAEAAYNVISKK